LSPAAADPVFSVVVPTLGRADALRNCLGALAGLDYPHEQFEAIVVNDGGGPEIAAIAERAGKELDLSLVESRGTGAAAARNAGLARARGRFVAFTDDDCLVDPEWLGALEAVLEANPGAGAGGRLVNGAPGAFAAGSQAVLDAAKAHFNRDPRAPRFFTTNNLALPAAGLREIGGFEESLLRAEDRELCERWIGSGRRLVAAPRAVVRHMRELTPLEFWRQHYGYGRGAWDVHTIRAKRGGSGFTVEPGFYRELAREAARPRNGAGRASIAALAVVSQLANAAGFASEAVSSRLRSSPGGATRPGPSR